MKRFLMIVIVVVMGYLSMRMLVMGYLSMRMPNTIETSMRVVEIYTSPKDVLVLHGVDKNGEALNCDTGLYAEEMGSDELDKIHSYQEQNQVIEVTGDLNDAPVWEYDEVPEGKYLDNCVIQ